MAYSYPVKWISSTMRGAPAISGTPGTFIAALDAFLLTGWGTVNAVSVSVAGGVGTATFAEGTFFDVDSIVLIDGISTPAALNGEARVLSRTNNSITFETDAPDGVATTGGTITVRYAPVGYWVKLFPGANKAVYRSTHVQASGHCLRVDDTGTTSARVVGYESMTSVDSGSGAFPTAAQVANGGRIQKSYIANASAARYRMFADHRAMLWAVQAGETYTPGGVTPSNVRGFGDPLVLAPSGDVWSTFLSAAAAENNYSSYGALSGGPASDFGCGFTVLARDVSGLGRAIPVNARPYVGSAGVVSGADTFFGIAPSDVDGRIVLSRTFLKPQSDKGPRATVPGAVYVPQTGASSLCAAGDVLQGAGEWAGKRLMAVACGDYVLGVAPGIAFVDITGPWR